LAASCYFYAVFSIPYLFLLFYVIATDYFVARFMEKASGAQRKAALGLSICANLGILIYFKYFGFFVDSAAAAGTLFGISIPRPALDVILPLGLSFHVFQSLSYSVEVYRGNVPAERHFGVFALYVMFFPQLVAGPIERPQNLLPQLHRTHSFTYDNAVAGLRWILLGLVKKIAIADVLAPYVNDVFGHVDAHTGLAWWLAAYAFAVQIYCDFSGYTDIARGSAKLLGYDLMQNFNAPYAATSLQDFWRRWHISLSTWFRDYVFVPLGGSRVSATRWALNVLVVFFLSGLWHGANFTFAVWGLYHGVLYALLESRKPRDGAGGSSRIGHVFRMLATFHLVCLGWIFFRAPSIGTAGDILRSAFDLSAMAAQLPTVAQIPWGVVAVVTAGLLLHASEATLAPSRWARWQRWLIYYAGIVAIIWFGRTTPKEFIYFQF
jgi:D-alanyl-lipoteichoic acid acyltransferase DltB (MBOAT superfamily)